MTSRVLRYTVAADDRVVARFCGPGPIVHVDSRNEAGVEFWVVVDGPPENAPARLFTVVGTGHDLPAGGVVRGTALTPPFTTRSGLRLSRGELVWHLVEVDPEHLS